MIFKILYCRWSILFYLKVFLVIFALLKGYILDGVHQKNTGIIKTWLKIVSPRHDPGPEFLQSAVTLPGIIFQVETKVQSLIKNGTKVKCGS